MYACMNVCMQVSFVNYRRLFETFFVFNARTLNFFPWNSGPVPWSDATSLRPFLPAAVLAIVLPLLISTATSTILSLIRLGPPTLFPSCSLIFRFLLRFDFVPACLMVDVRRNTATKNPFISSSGRHRNRHFLSLSLKVRVTDSFFLLLSSSLWVPRLPHGTVVFSGSGSPRRSHFSKPSYGCCQRKGKIEIRALTISI